jgi:hypothetical protein
MDVSVSVLATWMPAIHAGHEAHESLLGRSESLASTKLLSNWESLGDGEAQARQAVTVF